jgi:hypothetical protein
LYDIVQMSRLGHRIAILAVLMWAHAQRRMFNGDSVPGDKGTHDARASGEDRRQSAHRRRNGHPLVRCSPSRVPAMDESSAELRDRAQRYRHLATMVTDDKMAAAIVALAEELDRRSKDTESFSSGARARS